MFNHQHPYPPYIPHGTEKLIVGTLPPPRFTSRELLPGDVDFCYGSRDGQLWHIISSIFDTPLDYEDTAHAVNQRKKILEDHHIGICDIVAIAQRDKIDASDTGMKDVELRPIIDILRQNTTIHTLLFMGGNAKNGPEYFFRKHLKKFPEIHLNCIQSEAPRLHQFTLDDRIIQTVSLTAPSGAANRAVGSMDLYKKLKQQNPDFNTIDFRVMQYTPFFKSGYALDK